AYHRHEIGEAHVARAIGALATRQHVEIDRGDDLRAGIVASRGDVGHHRIDVDRARLAAVRRVEDRHVPRAGGNRDVRAGGAHRRDAGAAAIGIDFAGAAAGAERERDQSENGELADQDGNPFKHTGPE
ncbi:hypothetical protein QU38_00170, partial [Staphylococcus aureus]